MTLPNKIQHPRNKKDRSYPKKEDRKQKKKRRMKNNKKTPY